MNGSKKKLIAIIMVCALAFVFAVPTISSYATVGTEEIGGSDSSSGKDKSKKKKKKKKQSETSSSNSKKSDSDSEEDTASKNGFVIESGTLTGYTGHGGSISIPSSVTAIAGGAFQGDGSVTSISIPSSVKSIGASAFADCSNLRSINIPSSVTSVGAGALSNCDSLTSVSYSSSSFPSSILAGCSAITSFTLPSGVSALPASAFANCGNLRSVSLGSVSSIDFSAFSGCSNLTSISCSGSYSSSDGCVYSGSTLVYVPRGKTSLSVKSGTKKIGSGAVSGCSMSSVILPSSVKTIESGAFSSSSVNTITIPSSVTSIGGQSGWSVSLIKGKTNSAAQTYANSNSIPFESTDSGSSGSNNDSSDSNRSSSSGSTSSGGNTYYIVDGSSQTGSEAASLAQTQGIDESIPTKTYYVMDDDNPFTKSQMRDIIDKNSEYNISFETEDGVCLKFAKGSMNLVDGKDEYDMRINLILKYAKRTVDASDITPRNFAFELKFYYKGLLPAVGYVYVPIGTKYAGDTLYYYNCEDGDLENISYGTVSDDGYLIVSQTHCSNYVGLSEGIHVLDGTPSTADGFDIRYLIVIILAAVGGYMLIVKRKRVKA